MLFLVLFILLALGFWAVSAYNRLVKHRNQVRTAWADIDVQLNRRHDLVPALVTTVRAVASHERDTLEDVTSLRAQALNTQSITRLANTESELEAAISRVFALQENYPDLKASENFAQLQRDLVQVEDHLQYARRFYNGAVRDYNDACQRMPDAIIARAANFKTAEFFQISDEHRAAIHVELP